MANVHRISELSSENSNPQRSNLMNNAQQSFSNIPILSNNFFRQ